MLNAAAPVGRYDDGMSERDRPGACHRRHDRDRLAAAGRDPQRRGGVGFGARARLPFPAKRLEADEANELWHTYAKVPPTRPVVAMREESVAVTAAWFGTNLLTLPDSPAVPAFLQASPEAYGILVLDMGWPARSLRRIQSNVVSPTVLPGRPLPINNHARWLSEARPIWPGFAINTVFYAAILWLLFAAPFALRKWRRIRRGMCAKCGYDLRGSPHPSPLPVGVGVPVCPECGTRLPSPSR
jgi:hypothetical protein